MGWHEFLAYRKAMVRLRDGPEPDPEHWGEDLERDPFWAEVEQQRRERRGW